MLWLLFDSSLGRLVLFALAVGIGMIGAEEFGVAGAFALIGLGAVSALSATKE